MPRKQARERRRQRRFPVTLELRVKELLQLGTQKRAGTIFRAKAQNISTCGLGVVTNRPVEISSPLRCEIITGELPVPIPVMAQVRWVARNSSHKGYQVGLEFLV
jgi:hypothetical protein